MPQIDWENELGAFRILIVDDHDAVRRGVRSLLSTHADWLVCGEAIDGLEAVQKAKELRPNVVLMDVSMPRMNGIEATRIIRKEVPECHVIIVSQNDPSILLRQAAEVDARGYVLKADIARDLFPVLEKMFGKRNGKSGGNFLAEPVRVNSRDSLFGGGTLGKLIREYDWAQTPLGSIQSWPQSLRTAVNLMLNSQHPMWIGWGREMTFLYNDAYISVLSQAKHPGSLGKPAREVWREIWDVCGPLAEKVFSKGEPSFVDEVRLFMNRGDYLEETYYSFSYSPIYDESGKVAALFCPSAETTAKVLNTRRLQTLSELSSKALVERSIEAACASGLATLGGNPDDIPFAMLYLLDADGKVARRQATSRMPETTEPMEPVAPREMILGEGARDAEFWRLNQVVDTVQAQVVSVRGLKSLPLGPALQPVTEAIVLPVTSRGQDRPLAVLIAGINPTRPLDTEYRTFFTLVSDQVATAIQNAKAVEEEKKRADALAEIDRAKTVFFSNISHEFRTPLTLMLGPLEDALAESQALPAEQRERLEVAQRNSVRLLKLVNTLLDFSRMEAGRTQAQYEPTDLAAYTAELGSTFRSIVEGAGLRLIIRCAPLDEPVYVDHEMWEKIVFNLLSNAFKFTFEGEIELCLCRAGRAAEFSVRDTGTGIPAEEIPHLFERFHRVKGARGRTFEGSGIGLAFVQELTKLHAGTVRVESKLDQGSKFTVTLPLGSSHLPADRIVSGRFAVETGAAGAGAAFIEEALHWRGMPDVMPDDVPANSAKQTTSGPRPRILLADDNADMRDYVRKLLASKYEVEAVADGEAAVEAAHRRCPDLVLTDVMMPKLDGYAVLRTLRSEHATATVPVILFSARAGEESRIEGMTAGADDYLVKPFSARELMTRVETYLALAAQRKAAEERIRRSEEESRENTERLRALFDSSAVGVAVLTLDTRFLEVNDALCATTGYSAEELAKLSYTDLIHPDDHAAMQSLTSQLIAGGIPSFVLEERHIRKDGAIIWVQESVSLTRDAAHRPENIIALSQDITQRKRSEQASSLLAAIVESSDDAVITKNLDGIISSWNSSAERMFGYTREEAVGQHITLIIPPGRRQEETSIIERLKRGERIEHFDTIRMHKDGRMLDISLSISPVKDASGRVVGASKVARDVSERKQSERALAESARQQEALFQLADQLHRAESLEDVYGAALEAIVRGLQCERASVLRCDNHGAMRFVGWRGLSDGYRQAVEAHSPWKLREKNPKPICIPDVESADLNASLKATIEAERIRALAFIPLISNGKLMGKFMTYYDAPHVFSENELSLSLAIAQQLAFAIDRKRSEDALRESEERYRSLAETLNAEVRIRTAELEQRNADVERQSEQVRDLSGRLMRIQDEERRHIARELHDSAGQTLTVLGMTLARTLEAARRGAPQVAKEVEESQSLVQQLIREIRTTSYLLHPPLLDESGLAAALNWYVRGLADRSGLDIELKIAEEFGRLPGDMELAVFRLVQECLTNVHRHSGSKTAVIRILRESKWVRVEVEDRGKGMPPERLAVIQSRDSGVGIRGMRERVRQFHGEMEIESDRNGTKIIVKLPVSKDQAADEEGGAPLEAAV